MRALAPEQIAEIVRKHNLWLRSDPAGTRADLTGADLTGADLTGAVLTGADLTGAVLTDAVLTRAVLTRAVLTGAVLTGAVLTGADLTGADLTGADLTGADLTRAVLTGAVLTRAVLADAVLADAVLTGADLTGADLTGADLAGAVLTRAVLADAEQIAKADTWDAKRDLFRILRRARPEVPALLQSLRDGKVNGSTYQGSCACLVGTIAKARGVDYRSIPGIVPNSSRPAERWFVAIREGSTPANNVVAALTEQWILEFQAQDAAPVK